MRYVCSAYSKMFKNGEYGLRIFLHLFCMKLFQNQVKKAINLNPNKNNHNTYTFFLNYGILIYLLELR